jgi:hypothetical protein
LKESLKIWPRKILKVLGGLLLSLVIILLAIWFFPSLLINKGTLGIAKRILDKNGVHLQWEEPRLTARSFSFWEKGASLDLKKFCMEISSLGFHSCFDDFEVTARVTLKNGDPRLTALGPVILKGGAVRYVSPPSEKKEDGEEKESSGFHFSLPSELAWNGIENIQIEIPKIEVVTGDAKVKGSLYLRDDKNPQRNFFSGKILAEASVEKKLYDLAMDLGLDLKSSEDWNGKIAVSALNRSGSKSKEVLKAVLDVGPEKEGLKARGNLNFREGRRRANLNLEAEAHGYQMNARLSGSLREVVDGLNLIELRNCNFHRDTSTKSEEKLDLKCPFDLRAAPPSGMDFPYKKLVQELHLLLQANITREVDQPGNPVKGKILLNGDPLFQTIREGSGALAIDVKGKLSEFPNKLTYAVDSKVELKRFEKIVALFHNTAWAIPAPFNSLRGSIRLAANGSGVFKNQQGTLPLELHTDLSSETQKLKIDAKGELSFSEKKTFLNARAELSDVRLVLPPMDLRKPPQLVPDSRIHGFKTKQSKAPKETFEMDLEIITPENNPIRLVSNLAKRDIPIRLNLKMPPKTSLHGAVNISSFPLELFRRDARVEYVRLKLRPNSEQNEVEGKFTVSYVDYTITVLMTGLMAKPTLELYSDPPLPEKQVIAVLLFGRKLDELDADGQNSVGNTEAALADGAIGLASMYALASTPVESVGYDPGKKIFTAKIRLADGTSMNIGTDLQQVNRIGIRKRLTSRWNINTYLENPFLAAERSLTTFLEWNLRY